VDKERLANLSDITAKIWCPEDEGFDDLDRGAYRAGYFHGIGKKRGGF
jgi:hypothetical protein